MNERFDWRGFVVAMFIVVNVAMATWVYMLDDIIETAKMQCRGAADCELWTSLSSQSWLQNSLLVWGLAILALGFLFNVAPKSQTT